MKAQTLVPLAAAAAAQLLVVGNIAAAFAFQQKPPVETLVTVPVVAEIEQVECVRQDPVPYEPVTYQVPLDAELQSYTEKMCDLYDVPLELAYAVMQVESGFAPAAHSSTGDYGLMQINSINAGWLKDELGITDLLDARQNIQAGCYMLGMYLSEYEGNVNCALMAYNLGATGAKKAWSAGTYSTAYAYALHGSRISGFARNRGGRCFGGCYAGRSDAPPSEAPMVLCQAPARSGSGAARYNVCRVGKNSHQK